MLKGIPQNLSPDLVKILMEMGHGDEIVLADGNFPSAANANKLIRMDGVNVPELLSSLLELMPLDSYAEAPVLFMETEPGDEYPTIWKEYESIILKKNQAPVNIGYLERQLFYQRSRKAYCIVATGEKKIYGNIILRKGVIKEND